MLLVQESVLRSPTLILLSWPQTVPGKSSRRSCWSVITSASWACLWSISGLEAKVSLRGQLRDFFLGPLSCRDLRFCLVSGQFLWTSKEQPDHNMRWPVFCSQPYSSFLCDCQGLWRNVETAPVKRSCWYDVTFGCMYHVHFEGENSRSDKLDL